MAETKHMAKLESAYDWVVEIYDGPDFESAEIIDRHFWDCKERNYPYVMVELNLLELKHYRVGVQLSQGTHRDGVLFTATAYVDSIGLLDPVARDDETGEPVKRVPLKYIRQVEKWRASPLYRILH